jgi:hypothetical protein
VQNELNVLRPMLKNKELTDIIELYYELMAHREALVQEDNDNACYVSRMWKLIFENENN